MDYNLQQRLDAFVSGECTRGVFVQELFELCEATPESAWEVLALIDQYYRRGKLPAELFRTIKCRIEQHALGVPDSPTASDRPDGRTAAEALVGAAPRGAGAILATPERPASRREPARQLPARRIAPPQARRSAQPLRKCMGILGASWRRARSALAGGQRVLGAWRSQTGDKFIEWGRFMRAHINGEFIRPCVVFAVLAVVLLGIDSAPLPHELPKHADAVDPILPTAAAMVTPPPVEPGQISLSADQYLVFPGHASADIEVHRSAGVNGDVSFVWSTQRSAGTRPSRDYASRSAQTALLPDGVDTVHLSVPILANPSRKHTELFYVVIGKPGGGATLGPISRATVFIMSPD